MIRRQWLAHVQPFTGDRGGTIAMVQVRAITRRGATRKALARGRDLWPKATTVRVEQIEPVDGHL